MGRGRQGPTSHYITIPCPECGGGIPYEVEEQPPLEGLGKTRWFARDMGRECGCQIWRPEAGLTDDQAHGKAWAALDQRAIALAKEAQP